MRKLLFPAALAVCCFFASCNNSGGSSSGNDNNVQAAKDIMKGIETGDTSKFASIPDDAIDHTGVNGTEVKGGANIKKMLADMHNHVKDLKFDIRDVTGNGDLVYIWSTMTGTANDNTMGAPPGTKFDMKAVDILKFKDGKAAEHWGNLDQGDMMKMMPPPQQGPGNNQMNNQMKPDSSKMK